MAMGRTATRRDLTPSSHLRPRPHFSTGDDGPAAVNYPSQLTPHGIPHLGKLSSGLAQEHPRVLTSVTIFKATREHLLPNAKIKRK